MRILLFLVSVLTLTACSSAPSLPRPSSAFPEQLELAGTWQLVDQQVDDRMRVGGPGLIIPRSQRAAISVDYRKEPGMLARSFLERGRLLKITQLDTALLISFDRAIVEEYRYDELRIASIGPIRAQRSSGFRGEALEILTLDEDRALLSERWQIVAGDRLQRRVSITRKDKTLLGIVETYRRTD